MLNSVVLVAGVLISSPFFFLQVSSAPPPSPLLNGTTKVHPSMDLGGVGAPPPTTNQSFQHKNVVWNLVPIVKCRMVGSGRWTYKQAAWMLRYGCLCGPDNRGNVPIDGIDSCCQKHDTCYEEYAKNWQSECAFSRWTMWMASPYTEVYTQECMADHQVECPVENNKPCEQFLCQCDKKLVDCWMEQPSPSAWKGCGK